MQARTNAAQMFEDHGSEAKYRIRKPRKSTSSQIPAVTDNSANHHRSVLVEGRKKSSFLKRPENRFLADSLILTKTTGTRMARPIPMAKPISSPCASSEDNGAGPDHFNIAGYPTSDAAIAAVIHSQ